MSYDFNDDLRQLFIDFRHDRLRLGDVMRIAKALYYADPNYEQIKKDIYDQEDS